MHQLVSDDPKKQIWCKELRDEWLLILQLVSNMEQHDGQSNAGPKFTMRDLILVLCLETRAITYEDTDEDKFAVEIHCIERDYSTVHLSAPAREKL